MRLETEWELDVVQALAAARVVPVVSIRDAASGARVAAALARGGLRCVEITFRTPAAAEAIKRAREVDGVVVGAGTVLSPEDASAAAAAGAAFAVAPGTNEAVVAACAELGLPFFPGVATPTEIERARALGLRILKVFPASTCGGVAFLRAVSATYPDVRFLPTGGIRPESVAEYLALPSVLACGGSWLVDDDAVRDGRFDEVERRAREAVEVAA
jgi:2-dehydro-3-deoxyphosphogluconate aldolase / (4S)-4-hydroxy-2-oxoglutarate aldolase